MSTQEKKDAVNFLKDVLNSPGGLSIMTPFLPKAVTPAMRAFPANVVRDGYLPEEKDIPLQYSYYEWSKVEDKQLVRDAWKWGELFRDLLLAKKDARNLQLIPKDGIDPEIAWEHIVACMGSYAPKHEHKAAGCAYLLALWFEDYSWKEEETVVEWTAEDKKPKHADDY